MSAWHRRQAARATFAHREEYFRLLQEALPDLSPVSVKRGPLQQHVSRRRLTEAVEAGDLSLPDKWLPVATRALSLACAGIVPQPTLEQNDFFLSALIHPTYIPLPAEPRLRKGTIALRRAIAMPLETSLSGRAAVKVIKEALAAHVDALRAREHRWEAAATGQSSPRGEQQRRTAPLSTSGTLLSDALPPPVSWDRLARIPHAAGVETLLLYDAAFFKKSGAAEGVPEEVLLAAVTSLCGAISLSHGLHAVAAFLDRMLPRVALAPTER